jgi:predicted dehydrogenase
VTSARSEPRTGVGVVGTGFAAAAHIEALRRIPEVELVGIAGRDPGRTGKLAARHGLRTYTDYLELLADPAVEAVHTCTVNRLHHDVNLAALERGKHVLSEKPLAVDSEETARLVAAADRAAENGVVSGVCFNYRHYPLVAQIREMVRSGDYGPAHFLHGRYLQDWLLLESDWNWRLEEAQGGGSRAVADIGSHWSDLVVHITGDGISEVFADLGRLHSTRPHPPEDGASGAGGRRVEVRSEDFGTVLLRFDSGARGAFTVSQTSAGRKNGLSFQIDAAQAAFAWDQEQPDRAWVGRRLGPNLELVRDPSTMHPPAARLARLPAGHPEGWLDALRNVFEDFYAAVAARRSGDAYESDVASFHDGHARTQFVEAVMSSHREQRWTEVPTGSEVRA